MPSLLEKPKAGALDGPGFKSQLCPSRPGWPSANYLTSLGHLLAPLNIGNWGLSHRVVQKIVRYRAHEGPSTGPALT